MSMIQNIILDIGGVLVRSNDQQFFRDKGLDEETAGRVGKAMFGTEAWIEMDRGVWSFDKVIDAFVRNDPQDEAILRNIFTDTRGFVTVCPYAGDWIRGFQAKGLRVYCLSNWSEKILNDCREELKFLDIADGYVLSWQEKLVKPDPDIYRCLLQRYGLKAETCIFVDDSRVNVEAARALGIHGIVFEDQDQADREIRDFIKTH
ncbi:MAG: HAD family phosphatase [Lachnospiraceae bacterium]|nr:HAD family phosphatase [Lachnospiraceae bacterium]